MRVATAWWARWLLWIPQTTIELSRGIVSVTTRDGTIRLHIAHLREVALHRDAWWAALRLRFSGPANHEHPVLRGLPRRPAHALAVQIRIALADELAEALVRRLYSLCDEDRYIARSDLAPWLALAATERKKIAAVLGHTKRIPPHVTNLDALLATTGGATGAVRFVDARNDRWIAREISRRRDWFDQLGYPPLTLRQREAVVAAEDRHLVIAGPGSGKTSTLIGKFAYLTQVLQVPAHQILLLSFSRKTVSELRERIFRGLGVEAVLRTFHALGLEILAAVDGAKPSVSKLAEDEKALADGIRDWATDLVTDPRIGKPIRRFLLEYPRAVRLPEDFSTQHEYFQFLRNQNLRTLAGERVRSYQELLIANWLFANGVEYRYEMPYHADTATRKHSQYKPDFFLVESGIYIEHFGIDREGHTAPGIDQEEYRRSIEWKRDLHARHETTLIETYSYESREGVLLENLRQKLPASGVTLRPRTLAELRDAFARSNEIDLFGQIVGRFLNLFESGDLTLAPIREKVPPEGPRERAFLDVFETLHRRNPQTTRPAGRRSRYKR